MAAYTELREPLQKISGYFDRIDEHFIRPQHRSHLAGKGAQVGQVLYLISEKLPASSTLRENVQSKQVFKWIKNWAELYRISNFSLGIEQFVSASDEMSKPENTNALSFVRERLSDVDLVVASTSAKQLDAGDCLKKIIHKDTAVEAAIKECKVFNYLVDWVAVDVEGCHRKLKLASDRIAACSRRPGVPVLQWIFFAIAIPGLVVSTFFPHLLRYPIFVFAASIGLLVTSVRSYFKASRTGRQNTMTSILATIRDSIVISDILNQAANHEK